MPVSPCMKTFERPRPYRASVLLLAMSLLGALITTAAAQPAAPAIQLLNPSAHSTVISDKGGNYHLNAWGSDLPSLPLVEFEIQATGSPAITIGTAQRVGSDTFEFFWDVPSSLANGTYTLRAILYSSGGGAEVARDSQEVRLAHNSSPSTPSAETTEISYPQNGGQAGFYSPPGAQPNIVIDLASSPGTTRARVFYTVTSPGGEPTWKICGTESAAAAADGVRCTLATPDSPAMVSAVAAIANTTPVAPGVDLATTLNASGDAHRIQPYDQVPQGLTLDPAMQRVDAGAGSFPCSQAIFVTVVDQLARRIAGANVDVYAKGPTDQLAFDTSTGSSANQPPDQNGVVAEQAFNCSSGSFGGMQGDINRVGEPDRKQIESVGGTNDAGKFNFKLRTDSAGLTLITVYADADGNDLFCATEADASATIGWGQDATAPVPETQDTGGCAAVQTPTPTPSISPSTPSPSASPSSSPSTPSSSPTTPSASPSTTAPGPSPVQVTLESSTGRTRWSKTFTLSGRVSSNTSSCRSLVPVAFLRNTAGGDESFVQSDSTVADADGAFSLQVTADSSATYIARTSGSSLCSEGTSSGVTVLVRKVVRLTVKTPIPGEGNLKAKVLPCGGHEGDPVLLRAKQDGSMNTIAKKRSNDRCIAKFNSLFRGVYQAVSPKTDADHLGGKSPRRRV